MRWLVRTPVTVALFCVAVTACTWAMTPYVASAPITANRDLWCHVLALPYWTIAAPGMLLLRGCGWLIGAAVPEAIVPPPFTLAMLPSHVREEFAASAAAVALSLAVLVPLAAVAMRRRHVIVRAAACLAAAFIAVALCIPPTVIDDPPRVAEVLASVGRLATAPAAALMAALRVPLFLGRPGDSPPLLFSSLAFARGVFVWVTALTYLLLVTIVAALVKRRRA